MRIKTRQQRQRNTRGFGGLRDACGHFGDIGVGRAVAIVMQIMEFADAGKTLLQHLDIRRGRARCAVVRRHRQGKGIHRPAPVQKGVGATAAKFGEPAMPRWKAWLCRLASPGSAIWWRSSPVAGATPGVTSAIAPAVITTCTSLAQPEGRSAEAKCSRVMFPCRLDKTATRLYV